MLFGNLANALKCLVFFRNLSRLHLRFSPYLESDYNDNAESTFRYRVIDIVSHCIEATWTETNQNSIYDTLQKEDSEFTDAQDDLALSSGHGIRIKELTISNLADSIDPKLMNSEAWNKLLRLPTLANLKILVQKDFAFYGEDTFRNEMYEFFQALPSQWLSPSVAENLQVLSLFYSHY
ncbi:hypothetical protein Forpe1208_v013499 [Fusarium oxysporum f. sp. rapae]|uniref:Uncharacterized protein n=1 Tax=Fusarium oxysporum f. sp. rapae TaxID=485398 RepID=A0A8J5NL63_FUSOX|nr:hypothetical protein Forpe1208_v013499 [Fusarium oxysporum f. sp. rapae]